MAEEKKPKIDLKARLGKPPVGGATPPPPAVGIPVPSPSGSGSGVPMPVPSSNAGLSMPGSPLGSAPSAFGAPAKSSTNLDPSNPLTAAASYRAPAPPPPAAQRIEIDEGAVDEARKGARKQGLMIGVVAAVILGAVGVFMGGAMEANKGRQKSVADAKSLAGDVEKSKEKLKLLADKVDAGRTSLLKEKKFPEALMRELGALNIDFDGSKLAGVRFSGYTQETTSSLIEYISLVQTLNDRKSTIAGLLTRLQKPITEQFAAGTKTTINYVVLLGVQDPAKNQMAVLAPLVQPIEAANPSAITLPNEFTATDPISRKNTKAPKYTSGNLDKSPAIYVLPKSIEAACPSETAGSVAQLSSQLGHVVTDIRGEQSAAGGELVQETKAGLLERADRLVKALNNVQ